MNNQSASQHTISLQNTIADCKKLSEFLSSHVKSNNVSDEMYNDLRLAAEETFVNIASYAYTEEAVHSILIELSQSSNTISITFIDTGIAFNPLTEKGKPIDQNDYSEGGMGIQIIKSLTDELEYNRINDRNVFTVTKHYTQ